MGNKDRGGRWGIKTRGADGQDCVFCVHGRVGDEEGGGERAWRGAGICAAATRAASVCQIYFDKFSCPNSSSGESILVDLPLHPHIGARCAIATTRCQRR